MAPGKAKVEVEAFPRSQAIPATETCNEFPVLVRLTAAAWRRAEARPHTGVDVVAVVDIRSSMPAERLERIKQAMLVIIDKLRPDDRLSIVSLGPNVHRLTELTCMSGHGRDAARLKVDQLDGAKGTGLELAALPLREGALILRGREAEGSSRRVGCIMFLSAGDCREVIVGQEQGRECDFPVHTLGLGPDHDPKHMKHIADQTSGTYYSLVNPEDMIKGGALEFFLASLTSFVAARSVKITVRAHEGVAISSIESGGYGHRVSPDKLSGEISILDNIFAGEQKNFIVYLTVPEGGQETLMTVGGWYQGCKQLAETGVSVRRPQLEERPSMAIHGEVAAEVVRLRLEKGVSAMVQEEEEEEEELDGLRQLWEEIKASVDGRGAPEAVLLGLGNDVLKMKKSGLPYMLSWLSCHKWQRQSQRAASTTKATAAWQDLIPFSRLLIPCLLLLLVALLIPAITKGMCLSWQHKGGVDQELSQHPLWPMMEPSFKKELCDLWEETHYAVRVGNEPYFKKELRNEFLLAVVHASTGKETTNDQVKHQVEKYLQDMLQALEALDLQLFAATDDQHANDQINRHLYRATIYASILNSDILGVMKFREVEHALPSPWPMPSPTPTSMLPTPENPIIFWR